MQNKIVIILAGIFIIFSFGLVNTAVAHTGINDVVPTTARQDFVYSALNVPCNVVGWNATDPNSDLMGDVDGDAICDGWERSTGLLVEFMPPAGFVGAGELFTYSYPCGAGAGQDPQCPSRDHKDVYLELDWMKDPANSHVPAADVVQSVKNAWAAAPASNPDGTTGIRLHVQNGEWPASGTATQQGNIKWHKDSLTTNWSSQSTPSLQGFYRLKQYTFGTVCERFADTTCPADTGASLHINSNYLSPLVKNPLTAKFQVFHYSLVINLRTEQTSSSGWGEIWGNDHVWSLRSFTPPMGNAEQQKAVFMHELGHNFNLDHGGGAVFPAPPDATVNKPNYFSVMNPVFQFVPPNGKDSCRPLDYSRKDMNSLNENSLSEANGVRDSLGAGYLYPSAPWTCSKTWSGNAAGASLAPQTTPVDVAGTERFLWYSIPGSTTLNAFDRTNQAVNWNNDVPIDDSDSGLSQSINADVPKTTLTSTTDWNLLQFDFGDSAYAKTSQAEGLEDIVDQDAPPEAFTDENCDDVSDYLEEGETTSDSPLSAKPSFTTGCREVTVGMFEDPEETVGLLPPLQQIRAGVAPADVQCNDDVPHKIYKVSNGMPACVTESTATHLIAVGWGQENPKP